MKKILLLSTFCFLAFGCSSVVSKSNTLKAISLDPEVEPLPVVADLLVSEQKATGEANGTITQTEALKQGAITKALGQVIPSADNPDVLVGMNVFTEVTDNVYLKVTVTGYPAYYTNFRMAKEEDLKWLNIARLDNKAPIQVESQPGTITNFYFTPKYQLPFSEGAGGTNIDLEGGFVWDAMFLGLGVNFPLSFDDDPPFTVGAGLNFGGEFAVPVVQVAVGASAGIWLIEHKEEKFFPSRWYPPTIFNPLGTLEGEWKNDGQNLYVLAPFVKVRWQGIELMYRIFPPLFEIEDSKQQWSHQFMIGYNFTTKKGR